jgi:hypothetical protein
MKRSCKNDLTLTQINPYEQAWKRIKPQIHRLKMRIMLLQIITYRFQTTKVVCLVEIYAGQLLLICESVALFVSCIFSGNDRRKYGREKQEYEK